MPRGDAVQSQPSIADEMAKFSTFATTDGEISKGEPTADETARVAQMNADKAKSKGVAAKNAEQREPAKPTADGAANEEPLKQIVEDEEVPENETPEQKTARETAKATKQASADKRIGKAVAKQRVAERERAALQSKYDRDIGALTARLDAVEKKGLTSGDSKSNAEPVDPNAPKPSDFEYGELDSKYIRALARYEAKLEIEGAAKVQETKTQTAAQAKATAEFEQAKDNLEKVGGDKYDDFDEVVMETLSLPKDDPDFWPISPTVGELVLTSEQGADIAYYLATHKSEAKELFVKSPSAQAAWFGRQEAKYSAESKAAADDTPADDVRQPTQGKPPAKTTQAPPPLKNRAKGAGGKTQGDPATTDFKAFEAMAMASLQK